MIVLTHLSSKLKGGADQKIGSTRDIDQGREEGQDIEGIQSKTMNLLKRTKSIRKNAKERKEVGTQQKHPNQSGLIDLPDPIEINQDINLGEMAEEKKEKISTAPGSITALEADQNPIIIRVNIDFILNN